MSKGPHLSPEKLAAIRTDLLHAEVLRRDYARNWSRKALARRHAVSIRVIEDLATKAGLTVPRFTRQPKKEHHD
jgi:hypothetical protein